MCLYFFDLFLFVFITRLYKKDVRYLDLGSILGVRITYTPGELQKTYRFSNKYSLSLNDRVITLQLIFLGLDEGTPKSFLRLPDPSTRLIYALNLFLPVKEHVKKMYIRYVYYTRRVSVLCYTYILFVRGCIIEPVI